MKFLSRPCFTLLAAYLPLANCVPFWVHQIPGCQYPTLTSGSTYIYFTDPRDTTFYYSINTPWTTYYPEQLKRALLLRRFNLTENHATGDTDFYCGWNNLENVAINGTEHGTISYKRKSSKAGAPNKGTIKQIEKVLRNHSPDTDVFFLIAKISVPTLCVLIFMALVARYIHHSRKLAKEKEQAEVNSDGIELSSITSVKGSEATAPPQYEVDAPQLPSPARRMDSGFGSTSEWDSRPPLNSSSQYSGDDLNKPQDSV